MKESANKTKSPKPDLRAWIEASRALPKDEQGELTLAVNVTLQFGEWALVATTLDHYPAKSLEDVIGACIDGDMLCDMSSGSYHEWNEEEDDEEEGEREMHARN